MFDELRQRVRAAPFRPFRIRTNDGRSYEVRHPEFVGFTRTTVMVGVPDSDDPHHFAMLQMRNVTGVEPLAESRGSGPEAT